MNSTADTDARMHTLANHAHVQAYTHACIFLLSLCGAPLIFLERFLSLLFHVDPHLLVVLLCLCLPITTSPSLSACWLLSRVFVATVNNTSSCSALSRLCFPSHVLSIIIYIYCEGDGP